MSGLVNAVEQRARSRVGSTLRDKYTLEALLGVGGTAAVYRAAHRNGHRVAIKMLHREISLDSDIRSRFLSEGYAANKVRHDGVMRVLDDDTAEDGSTFLVMELLDGQTLDERARENGGTLPAKDVLAVAYQLLDVLAAAHERGIIHRDVKPENLFLTREGALKILDFGIARVRDLVAAHATVNGQVFGTPAFMPPEQALGQPADVDHRSDLWAVGATMFTLLSGRFVYEGETAAQHLVQAAYTNPPSLTEVLADAPSHVAAIVDRALSRERDLRWQSARDMQRAVEEAHAALFGAQLSLGEMASRAPAVSVLGQSPTLRFDHDAKKRRAVIGLGVAIGAGALAAVAGIALLSWWLGQTPHDDSNPVATGAPPTISAEAPRASSPPSAISESEVTPAPPASSIASPPKLPRRPPRAKTGPTGAFDYQ